MTAAAPSATKSFSWRLPIIIVLCGCTISVLTFGPRSSLGFFLTPLSQANGWGRDVFALSLALQNLLWGSASRSPARSPTNTARRGC